MILGHTFRHFSRVSLIPNASLRQTPSWTKVISLPLVSLATHCLTSNSHLLLWVIPSLSQTGFMILGHTFRHFSRVSLIPNSSLRQTPSWTMVMSLPLVSFATHCLISNSHLLLCVMPSLSQTGKMILSQFLMHFSRTSWMPKASFWQTPLWTSVISLPLVSLATHCLTSNSHLLLWVIPSLSQTGRRVLGHCLMHFSSTSLMPYSWGWPSTALAPSKIVSAMRGDIVLLRWPQNCCRILSLFHLTSLK